MNEKIFEPGDVFKFRDKEYIVIRNYGATGLIKECKDNGVIIKGFSWNQESEPCIYIRTEKNEMEIIKYVNEEYENFFEKYKLHK